MADSKEKAFDLVKTPAIDRRIFVIRERQVMLDEDLADLYGVETKRLVEQVKRNVERFPADFMFQLDETETAALRSQIATSNSGRGGRRYAPYVFTEQGVAMLSGCYAASVRLPSILRSCARLSSCAVPQPPMPHSRSSSESLSERPPRSSVGTTSSWIRSSRH